MSGQHAGPEPPLVTGLRLAAFLWMLVAAGCMIAFIVAGVPWWLAGLAPWAACEGLLARLYLRRRP